MQEEYVECAKCLMDGSMVRVDVKHQGSATVMGTPMLITSNNDITQVSGRGTITGVHAEPIKSRCTRFHFCNPLPDDYGRLTPQDVSNFMIWGINQLGGPGLDCYKDHFEVAYEIPTTNPCSDCTFSPSTKHNYRNKYVTCDTCPGFKLIESEDTSTEFLHVITDHSYSKDPKTREAQACERAGK